MDDITKNYYINEMNRSLTDLDQLVWEGYVTQAEERKIKRKIKKRWKPIMDNIKRANK